MEAQKWAYEPQIISREPQNSTGEPQWWGLEPLINVKMKKISITHEDKNYPLMVTLVEAHSSGYFVIEWRNKRLQRIIPSPIYMEYRNGNSMVLPPSRNIIELTFFTSIAQGIFLDYISDTKVLKIR